MPPGCTTCSVRLASRPYLAPMRMRHACRGMHACCACRAHACRAHTMHICMCMCMARRQRVGVDGHALLQELGTARAARGLVPRLGRGRVQPPRDRRDAHGQHRGQRCGQHGLPLRPEQLGRTQGGQAAGLRLRPEQAEAAAARRGGPAQVDGRRRGAGAQGGRNPAHSRLQPYTHPACHPVCIPPRM
eukprot:scaffold45055_cov70-Phaeocystis_antarctica.AAC.4